MPDANTIECAAACTVTVQHEITLPILNLTPYEGGVIAGAILSVWAAAYAFRLVIRFIRDSYAEPTERD